MNYSRMITWANRDAAANSMMMEVGEGEKCVMEVMTKPAFLLHPWQSL